MINGSDFFATERYLRTRFLLLILGGVPILSCGRCWINVSATCASRTRNDGLCHRSLHCACGSHHLAERKV